MKSIFGLVARLGTTMLWKVPQLWAELCSMAGTLQALLLHRQTEYLSLPWVNWGRGGQTDLDRFFHEV